MATSHGGRDALQDYLAKTISRLQQNQSMDASMLKNKVMPSIVEGIKNLSSGAPQDVRDEFYRILNEGGVLPNYEADITKLEEALQRIDASLQKSLGDPSASQECVEEPDEFTNDAMESDSVQPLEPDEVPGKECVVVANDQKLRGQKVFHDYVRKILSKLGDPASRQPEKTNVDFVSDILPQILGGLQQLSSQAPAGLKVNLARILTSAQLWPYVPIGMDPRKSHLANFPKNAGISQAKLRIHEALKQISSMMQLVISGSPDAYRIGLSSPINIEIVGMSGDQIAIVPVESGASVVDLRKIMSAFSNRPGDMLSFVKCEAVMDDDEAFLVDCQIVMVSGEGDTLSGIYAGYSCDFLILYPNGETAAFWYDDYWQPSKDEPHKINCQICDHSDVKNYASKWADGTKTNDGPQGGSWTVSNNGMIRCVSGTAYDPYMDNLYTFKFDVKYDKAFSEGISPLVLDGIRYHHFSHSNPDSEAMQEPETNRFYLVSRLATIPT